jgi:hypothetical protein
MVTHPYSGRWRLVPTVIPSTSLIKQHAMEQKLGLQTYSDVTIHMDTLLLLGLATHVLVCLGVGGTGTSCFSTKHAIRV